MPYTYINRRAGTPDFKRHEEVLSLQPSMIQPKRFEHWVNSIIPGINAPFVMPYTYINRRAGTPDFKRHEEVLSLQPSMIQPKRFDILDSP